MYSFPLFIFFPPRDLQTYNRAFIQLAIFFSVAAGFLGLIFMSTSQSVYIDVASFSLMATAALTALIRVRVRENLGFLDLISLMIANLIGIGICVFRALPPLESLKTPQVAAVLVQVLISIAIMARFYGRGLKLVREAPGFPTHTSGNMDRQA